MIERFTVHRRWRVALSLAVIVLAPKEAIVGTYSSYTDVRQGYTLAMPIDVGSLASFKPNFDKSQAEYDELASRRTSAEKQAAPYLKALDALVARVMIQDHPFKDRLGAIDRDRGVALNSDFEFRLPAPAFTSMAPPSRRGVVPGIIEPPAAPLDPLQNYRLYIHMKSGETALRRQRALVGWALAQAYLGGYGREAKADEILQQLSSVTSEDLAGFILKAQSHQDVLEKIAQDPAQAPSLRLRAGLLLMAYKNESLTEKEWALCKGGEGAEWMLLLAPERDLPDVRNRLEKRMPR